MATDAPWHDEAQLEALAPPPVDNLRALLGDGPLVDSFMATASSNFRGWADGYGVVAPDVSRYVEVLREVPDALLLAMRNMASAEDLPLLDPDSSTLICTLARSMRPERVLEIGAGIGQLTLLLTRAVAGDCTITSTERDPLLQERAHAFLEREEFACAVELRLGEPLRLLRERSGGLLDLVIIADESSDRRALVDEIVPRLAPDGLLLIPFSLLGGAVADGERAWGGEHVVERQRAMNRSVATDPRLCDVALLPVGDGLLMARRRS